MSADGTPVRAATVRLLQAGTAWGSAQLLRTTTTVAQNTEGNIFVSANGGDQVFAFHPDGEPLPGSPFGDSNTFHMPLGAASDSLGNVGSRIRV